MSELGTAIAIAWPETLCKQAGAWYDPLLKFLGMNQSHYYKVGHAAVVLLKNGNKEIEYFDFGRYHAPFGHGRVRSAWTDHDLKIEHTASYNKDQWDNIKEVMTELQKKEACHGDGKLWYSVHSIHYKRAKDKALELQNRGAIPYGPFTFRGSNCSRFVCSVLQSGALKKSKKTLLRLPYTFSPTPKSNVRIWGKIKFIENVN